MSMARILFVDDDDLTLDLMDKVSSLLGHQAILSSSGSAAIAAAEREHPQLILIDLHLPDYDGIEVARCMRQIPTVTSTPIFILSAGVQDQVAYQARQVGAQGCLEKPLSMDTLTRVVDTYIKN